MTDLLHKARHKSPSEAGSSPLPPPSNSGPCFRALAAHLGPLACLSPRWGTDACMGRALPAFQRDESCRREPRLHIMWQGLSRLIGGTKLTDGDNAQKSPETWKMQPALLMHFNKMYRRYTWSSIASIPIFSLSAFHGDNHSSGIYTQRLCITSMPPPCKRETFR